MRHSLPVTANGVAEVLHGAVPEEIATEVMAILPQEFLENIAQLGIAYPMKRKEE